jgi:hypothetical protein
MSRRAVDLVEVFRFFPNPEHAADLLKGRLMVSTLVACRRHEKEYQGDPGEATETYFFSGGVGSGSDPRFAAMTRRAQIEVEGDASNVAIGEVQSELSLRDAYLICTAIECDRERMAPTFGEHCVRIRKPTQFFGLVTQQLLRKTSILDARFGVVDYVPRDYRDMEARPGKLGMVKPPSFAWQQEARFLCTVPQVGPLTPMLLDVPEAAHLCSIVE